MGSGAVVSSPVGWSQQAFLGLIALLALQRAVELLVSRARLAGRGEALVAEPRLFAAMVLLHVSFLVLPPLEVLALERPFRPWLAIAAGSVLALATALRIWTLRTLGRAWNVRVVVPEAVVTSGPYRWIRHPNYLVVILELASVPLLHGAWWAALALSLLNGCVLAARIRTEEAALMQLPAWREAMAARARLVPGVF